MNRSIVVGSASICRWIARTLGAVLFLVCATIAIGQGLPNPLTQPAVVQFGFLELALILGGTVAGWRWELVGGAASVFGWCVFVATVTGRPRGITPFVAALVLPGALYIVSALLRQKANSWRP